MKFRYVGDEYTEWFGLKWMTGTEHDVTDEHAIRKLSGSALFAKVEAAPVAETVPSAQKPRKQRTVTADGNDQNAG